MRKRALPMPRSNPSGASVAREFLSIWRAGRVRRWHQSAELSATSDFLDGHAGRVARTVLHFDPKARSVLLAACLTHDDGEALVGDISTPRKLSLSAIARAELEGAEAAARESVWGQDFCAELSADEARLLRMADRLDALLWVWAHVPLALSTDDWRAAVDSIRADARGFPFSAEVCALLGSVSCPPPRGIARLRIFILHVLQSHFVSAARVFVGLIKGQSYGTKRKSDRAID